VEGREESEEDIPMTSPPSEKAPRPGKNARTAARPGFGERPGPKAPRTGDKRRAGPPSAQDFDMTRLFIGVGRQAGVRPADLVGAIAGEAGVEGRRIGSIEIGDNYSLVEVPEPLADQIVAALRQATLRGKKVQVRRDKA
jgi:ATP-dependent RNA helicase DeaD